MANKPLRAGGVATHEDIYREQVRRQEDHMACTTRYELPRCFTRELETRCTLSRDQKFATLEVLIASSRQRHARAPHGDNLVRQVAEE